MKPLAAWTRDLVLRVEQLEKWATTAHPPNIFWMSGYTFPTGFLTAVLQTSARFNNVSVDSLSWEFSVMTVDDSNITGPPKVRAISGTASYWEIICFHGHVCCGFHTCGFPFKFGNFLIVYLSLICRIIK